MRNVVGILILLCGSSVACSSGEFAGYESGEFVDYGKRFNRTFHLKEIKEGGIEHEGSHYEYAVTLSYEQQALPTCDKKRLALDSLRAFENVNNFNGRNIDLGFIEGAVDAHARFTTADGCMSFWDKLPLKKDEDVAAQKPQKDIQARRQWLRDYANGKNSGKCVDYDKSNNRTFYLKQVSKGGIEHEGSHYEYAVTLDYDKQFLPTHEKERLALNSLRAFENVRNFNGRKIDLGFIEKAIDVNACFTTADGDKTFLDALFGDENAAIVTPESQDAVEERFLWLIHSGMQYNFGSKLPVWPLFTLLGSQNTGNVQKVLAIAYDCDASLFGVIPSAQAHFKAQIKKGIDKKKAQEDVLKRIGIFSEMRCKWCNTQARAVRLVIAEALKDPEKFFMTEDKLAGKKRKNMSEDTK